MDNLGCMATSTRPRPHKFKEEGYSGYAAEQRQIARQAGQTVDENYIGPARTHFAARQGRKRIAGYSAVRQGGRDEARARAEERKQGAFTRLNEARSRSFGGLKEMDTMKSNPNFARAETPALDDHFKGQRPVSSVKPKPTNATPAARGPLPGFFDPLKNRPSTGIPKWQQEADEKWRAQMKTADEVDNAQSMVLKNTENLPNGGTTVGKFADDALEKSGRKITTRPEKPWYNR